MNSSTRRFSILVLTCFITIWQIFVVERSETITSHFIDIRKRTTVAEDFVQKSFDIPVDFCWSTEPIDVVYLLDDNVGKSHENWNMDLFKASVKGLSLYLPWIRTIHVFSKNSRTGFGRTYSGGSNVVISTIDNHR